LRLVLDTHIIVWMTSNARRLSAFERDTLNDPAHELIATAVSFWELRLKWDRYFQSGDRKGPGDPVSFLQATRLMGIKHASLDVDQVVAPLQVNPLHGDPFDALLLLQTQQLGAKLLTRDKKLIGHPLVYAPD
jgi:PIN domain nuclease of toxin-antitoxin system